MNAVTQGQLTHYRPGLRRCPACQKFFTFYHGLNDCKKYCSRSCVQKAWRQRNPKQKVIVDRSYGFYLGQCPGCGKDVWGVNKQQRYCPGSKCSVAALRKRRAEVANQPITERSLHIEETLVQYL